MRLHRKTYKILESKLEKQTSPKQVAISKYCSSAKVITTAFQEQFQ